MAGATHPLVAAISGHTLASVNTILERYLVRTRKMARAAFAKRLEADAAEAERRQRDADGEAPPKG
ncbi:MAG: hypothetical protein V3R75_07915 [Alphaproteobacteria bacterium]